MLTPQENGEIRSLSGNKTVKISKTQSVEEKKRKRRENLYTLHSYLLPNNGGVAQLGEHLPCKQGVMGSNPIISTMGR